MSTVVEAADLAGLHALCGGLQEGPEWLRKRDKKKAKKMKSKVEAGAKAG
jgi:hypothetical protein